jgi:hypothetical protein
VTLHGAAGQDETWLARLEEWSAAARAREATDARSRERSLRRQAAEEATLAGHLMDLAEAGSTVILRTTTGRRHHGAVVAVGYDFVSVSSPTGRTVYVAIDAVAVVQPTARARRSPEALGSARPVTTELTLAEALREAAADRPRAQLRLRGGPEDALTGELRSVGLDVLGIVTDGDPTAPAYVRLASVSEISLLDSG